MKFTIIGMGSIGTRHAASLRLQGHVVQGFEPMYASDDIADCENLRELLDWCDAVLICSPSKTHAGYLKLVVPYGKDIFMEKPFATADFDAVNALALKASKEGVMIATGYNLRFHHCVKTAKAIIDSGRLGVIWNAEFSVLQKMTKDAYLREHLFLNWAVHEIDLAEHLLGPIKTVDWAKTDESGAYGTIMGTHDNFCKTTIKADYVTDPEVRKFDITGSKGKLECDLVKRTLTYTPAEGEPQVHQMADSFDENYKDEMAAFVEAIQDHKDHPILANHIAGLRSLHVALQAVAMSETMK